MKRYYVFDKRTNERKQIDATKEDAFFRIIAQLTGLDKAIARAILHKGQFIDHPDYRFMARDVNPFAPADLGEF